MFQHVFLYMSIKNKRIPMGLNVDLNKINKQQQEIQTVTPVEVKSTSASVNVPIGKTETANTDLCSKLGITQEQYVKLCTENPQFLTLSFDNIITKSFLFTGWSSATRTLGPLDSS